MSAYIYEALKKYAQKNISSFHTPGHKGQVPTLEYKYFFDNIIGFDLTELPQTDNLLSPNGIILKSEKKATKLFNSKKTIYSTFGCTLCIQTMIKIAYDHTRKIIADRRIHKSAVNAFALLDLEVIWFYPSKKSDHKAYLNELKRLISENQDAGAVYITSPSYYGEICDIDGVAELCHENNRLLLVDNAHGSHLYFVDKKLKNALCKVDMVACSLHKTLPVMTGGAILNINNKDCCTYADEAYTLFSGTSPSYPILVSIDLCIDYLSQQEPFFLRKYLYKVEKIRELAKKRHILSTHFVSDDYFRVVLSAESLGIDGFNLAKMLYSYGIEPEFADSDNVVMIFTFTNTDEDFERVENFINSIELKSSTTRKKSKLSCDFLKPKVAMSMRQALLSKSESVNVKDAVNRIAYDSICRYPPGIPIILSGEIIDKLAVEQCLKEGITEIKVVKE